MSTEVRNQWIDKSHDDDCREGVKWTHPHVASPRAVVNTPHERVDAIRYLGPAVQADDGAFVSLYENLNAAAAGNDPGG